MRKLNRIHLLAFVLLAGAAVTSIAIGSQQAQSAQPLPPMLTAREIEIFEISQAVDITSNPAALTVIPRVPSSQAVDIASRHLGRGQTNVRILHAVARPIHDLPARSVWIVMFAGGTLPVLGPAGNTVAPRE